MWPFRKQYPPLEELCADGQWAVCTGEYEGRPMLVRRNGAGEQGIGHPSLPYQIGVAVPFLCPREDGMPPRDEDEQLHAIEDALSDSLKANNLCVFVLVITTKGMREFVFYTGDPDAVRGKVEAIQQRVQSHEVQLMIQHDPHWNVFRQFR